MGNTTSTRQRNIEKALPELSVPFGSGGKPQAGGDICLRKRTLEITLNSPLEVNQLLAVSLDDTTESFWLVDHGGLKIQNIGKNAQLLECTEKGYIYQARVKSISNKSAEIEITGAHR